MRERNKKITNNERGERMDVRSIVSRGVTYINVTPHAIRLQWPDGEEFMVEPSGVLINATPENKPAGTHRSGVELVRVVFTANSAETAKLIEIEVGYRAPVVLGSIIAAQAFPGRVLGMIPAPGFERVPTEEKRMRADRFATY